MPLSDRELGMGRRIGRRDFLNGMAMAVGASAMPAMAFAGGGAARSKYPPALTGLRGHHPGSYEAIHAIRDGDRAALEAAPLHTGERYDLVVVGAGISGLTAAFQYRRQNGPKSRILILDNHDDFGGHAKRNEFTASNGRLLIGYGGSQSLQSPSFFSPAVNDILAALAVKVSRFGKYYDQSWFEDRGLAEGFFFTRESFGADRLVRMADDSLDWIAQSPLNDKAKADLVALHERPGDYFSGMDRAARRERMSQLTYGEFLRDHVKADPQVIAYFQQTTHEYFGCGIDAVSCADAWAIGNPGFDGMDLGDEIIAAMSPSGRLNFSDPDEYIHHFPDGNASIARLLVRSLVPGVLKGSTMEDIVLSPCNYANLDRAKNPVRIRLESPAVRVRHEGDPVSAKSVEVSYLDKGRLATVTAGHVILACFNQVIPHIAPEIGEAQGEALRDQQKIPLLYTNVLIRDWKAFRKLGVHGFASPGHYWDKAEMDFSVSMGGYKFADKPGDPVLLHVGKAVASPDGGSLRDQAVAGRYWVEEQKFEDMERAVRDLLARALGEGGFDPARDIEAITVNRWSHGYAYEYMRPWDAYWPDGELPIRKARRGWGRIAIANSDAGAYAYAHSAIDQAIRAVRELLGEPAGAPAIADFPGPPRDRIGLG
jgi:spermidine dehydrogenase